MDDDQPIRWIGRGLDVVAGKPEGWAWERERAEIRRHIHAKLKHRYEWVGARRFWNTHRGRGVEYAIDRIQMRIHRSNPIMIERLRQAHLAQLASGLRFTIEELRHIAERFAGANDPVGQAIAMKIVGIAEDRT